MNQTLNKIDEHNFDSKVFKFRDRQAGISMIYDPQRDVFTYNAYCLELKLLTELFSEEFDTLDDAISRVNEEFAQWPLVDVAVAPSAGCGGGCGKSSCCCKAGILKE